MEKKKENTAGGSDWPKAREHPIVIQGAVLSSGGGWRPASHSVVPCASSTPVWCISSPFVHAIINWEVE